MADTDDWAFPELLQPKDDDVRFDLGRALDAVVAVRSEIPDDAFTAPILGSVRNGNGVVIREDGLVLTIGYLITEAQTVWLTTNGGTVVPAHPLAYDQTTGFGLVHPLGRLGVPALPRGTAASCDVGDEVIVIGHGGRAHALKADVVAKREFAGYWEYVLDEALFTAPAHPEWGGSAVVGPDGRLIGIGSLLVQETIGDRPVQGNMIVPIDILEPIFADMLRLGRPDRPPRPWLGMYTTEQGGQAIVAGLADGGPADQAGVRVGDVVVEVGGDRVQSLAALFRAAWRLGASGVEVPLTLVRESGLVRLRVRSADRSAFLRKPVLH
jgi:S1-C subfamily serine protease